MEIDDVLLGRYCNGDEYREFNEAAARILNKIRRLGNEMYIRSFVYQNKVRDTCLLDIMTPLFIRDILSTTYSIQALIGAGCIDSGFLLIRNLLEVYLSASFIYSSSQKEGNRRIAYYVYHHILEKEEIAGLIKPGARKFHDNQKQIVRLAAIKNKQLNKKEMERIDAIKETLVAFPEYNETSQNMQALISEKPEMKKWAWYRLYDSSITSIRELMKRLDHEELYPTIFRIWSAKVHGTNIFDHGVMKNTKVCQITAIRNAEGALALLKHTTQFALYSMAKISRLNNDSWSDETLLKESHDKIKSELESIEKHYKIPCEVVILNT